MRRRGNQPLHGIFKAKSVRGEEDRFHFTRRDFTAFLPESKAKIQMARPKKIQWPINFEEMLRYAFGKKRPEDRLKIFRLFLRDFLHPQSTAPATPEAIEAALLENQKKQFDENWAHHIRLWSEMSFEKWKKENFKLRDKKRAQKRWPKKN
jgi:hypothetical protein